MRREVYPIAAKVLGLIWDLEADMSSGMILIGQIQVFAGKAELTGKE